MLTDKQLETVSVRLYNRLNKVNADYLIKIGERIKEIGDLRPTEVHQIQRIYEMAGQDIDAITAELALAGGKTIDDINELFRAVAKENYDYSAPFYEAKGIKQIPFDDNRKLQEYIASVANQTVDEFKNLTQHTAFMVWGKNGEVAPAYFKENVRKIPTSLSETYTRAIDEAVTKAQLGLTDYRSAIRDTVRALADSGIKTVDYATGYSRRLDSSVEQNVLWGLKQCNQHISDRVGEEFGADGYEIDYHSNPRPSHAEMGGRGFT